MLGEAEAPTPSSEEDGYADISAGILGVGMEEIPARWHEK
jgi:hypothetical protein